MALAAEKFIVIVRIMEKYKASEQIPKCFIVILFTCCKTVCTVVFSCFQVMEMAIGKITIHQKAILRAVCHTGLSGTSVSIPNTNKF